METDKKIPEEKTSTQEERVAYIKNPQLSAQPDSVVTTVETEESENGQTKEMENLAEIKQSEADSNASDDMLMEQAEPTVNEKAVQAHSEAASQSIETVDVAAVVEVEPDNESANSIGESQLSSADEQTESTVSMDTDSQINESKSEGLESASSAVTRDQSSEVESVSDEFAVAADKQEVKHSEVAPPPVSEDNSAIEHKETEEFVTKDEAETTKEPNATNLTSVQRESKAEEDATGLTTNSPLDTEISSEQLPGTEKQQASVGGQNEVTAKVAKEDNNEPPKTEQKAITEDDILLAALKLFAKQGYFNTSLPDIAKAVGASSSNKVYRFFKTKQAIVAALYENILDSLSCSIDDIRRRNSKPSEQLHEIVDLMFTLTDEAPEVMHFLLVMNVNEVLAEAKPLYQTAPFIKIHKILQTGIKNNEIRSVDAHQAYTYFFGVINHTLALVLSGVLNKKAEAYLSNTWVAAWNTIAKK